MRKETDGNGPAVPEMNDCFRRVPAVTAEEGAAVVAFGFALGTALGLISGLLLAVF